MNEHPEEFEQQSLVEHLADLRRCLIGILIAAGLGFVVSYAFVDTLGDWLLKPLRQVLPANTTLIFTSYQEGFFFT
jgi:Sec-independent protein secretion pathway component TatC